APICVRLACSDHPPDGGRGAEMMHDSVISPAQPDESDVRGTEQNVPGTEAALTLRLRQLAWQAATAIHDAFDQYQMEFRSITRRSQQRFERREWHYWQADAVERLDLYERVLVGLVS